MVTREEPYTARTDITLCVWVATARSVPGKVRNVCELTSSASRGSCCIGFQYESQIKTLVIFKSADEKVELS